MSIERSWFGVAEVVLMIGVATSTEVMVVVLDDIAATAVDVSNDSLVDVS